MLCKYKLVFQISDIPTSNIVKKSLKNCHVYLTNMSNRRTPLLVILAIFYKKYKLDTDDLCNTLDE